MSGQGRGTVSQVRVLRSEWTKLRTVNSTWWSLSTTVLLLVGFGVLYAMVRVARPPASAQDVASFDATAVALAGVGLAQLAVGVLGVLAVTGEYATGLIRTSVAAVPTRLPVLYGKAVAFGVVTVLVTTPAAVVAFVAGQSILRAERLDVGFGDPGVLRAVAGAPLYLAAIGLLGLALGALLRHTAGAVSALFGVLFGLPIIVGLLPASVADDVHRFLPGPAGQAVTQVDPDPQYSLAPWAGLGVCCLYVGVLFALAAWRLRTRDL